jgi:hypothetical protein
MGHDPEAGKRRWDLVKAVDAGAYAFFWARQLSVSGYSYILPSRSALSHPHAHLVCLLCRAVTLAHTINHVAHGKNFQKQPLQTWSLIAHIRTLHRFGAFASEERKSPSYFWVASFFQATQGEEATPQEAWLRSQLSEYSWSYKRLVAFIKGGTT